MTMQITSSPFPVSEPVVDNQAPIEQSMPKKVASYAMGTAVQIPVNFCKTYASLFVMEKSYQATSATVGFLYSGVSSILSSAYCTVATCTPDPVNTAIDLILNSTTDNATNSSNLMCLASQAPPVGPSTRWMTKGDISMLAATGMAIRPVASYCFNQMLGCNEDTHWRNKAASVASTITTTAMSSYATNLLGFQTDTASLVQKTIYSMAFAEVVGLLMKTESGQKLGQYFIQQMKEEFQENEIQIPATEGDLSLQETCPVNTEDTDIIDSEVDAQLPIDPARVKHFTDLTLAKVDGFQRNIFQVKNNT